MAGDLRALAEKYVALTGEVENVRRAMLSALTNGAGDKPNAPFDHAQRRGGSTSSHPNAIAAAKAERGIIELLRTTPGLKSSQIATATNAKANTTIERLKRMKAKGLVERDDASAGWAACA